MLTIIIIVLLILLLFGAFGLQPSRTRVTPMTSGAPAPAPLVAYRPGATGARGLSSEEP